MQDEERQFLQQHAQMLSEVATEVLRAQMEVREFIWKQETAQMLRAEKDETIANPVKRIP